MLETPWLSLHNSPLKKVVHHIKREPKENSQYQRQIIEKNQSRRRSKLVGFLNDFSDFKKTQKPQSLSIRSYNLNGHQNTRGVLQIPKIIGSNRSYQPKISKKTKAPKSKNCMNLKNKTISLSIQARNRCNITGKAKISPLNLVKNKGFSVRKKIFAGQNIYKNSRWGLYRGSFYNLHDREAQPDCHKGNKKLIDFHNLDFLNKKNRKNIKITNTSARLGNTSSTLQINENNVSSIPGHKRVKNRKVQSFRSSLNFPKK